MRYLSLLAVLMLESVAVATPPGWELVWNDDFNAFDSSKWDKITSYQPTNNSQHAYLPQQVTTSDGYLVILSENVPAGGLPYRSGQVISKTSQRLGRWEVSAKLPTSAGMWPAIWLLPNTSIYPWPSQGEIDIMENRGSQPNLTSSAYHFGSNPPYFHDFDWAEQQTSQSGQLVNYHNGFHTYAVDWYNDRLQFYVDDVNFYTLYDQDVSNEISSSTAPMQLVINTAIGGDFLEEPNASTIWPQQFLIDSVRVFRASDTPSVRTFSNGSFEANGGTLANWSLFGATTLPNVRAHNEAVLDGDSSLKIFGQFSGGTNYSGVSQGISVASGQQVRAELDALIRSADSLAGTTNVVSMKIEFYDHFGAKFGTSAMLDVEEIIIGNSSTANNLWNAHELIATAPSGAVEARFAIVFTQRSNGGGAIHIDDIRFALLTLQRRWATTIVMDMSMPPTILCGAIRSVLQALCCPPMAMAMAQ